jgi:hypothetical protein
MRGYRPRAYSYPDHEERSSPIPDRHITRVAGECTAQLVYERKPAVGLEFNEGRMSKHGAGGQRHLRGRTHRTPLESTSYLDHRAAVVDHPRRKPWCVSKQVFPPFLGGDFSCRERGILFVHGLRMLARKTAAPPVMAKASPGYPPLRSWEPA